MFTFISNSKPPEVLTLSAERVFPFVGQVAKIAYSQSAHAPMLAEVVSVNNREAVLKNVMRLAADGKVSFECADKICDLSFLGSISGASAEEISRARKVTPHQA